MYLYYKIVARVAEDYRWVHATVMYLVEGDVELATNEEERCQMQAAAMYVQP